MMFDFAALQPEERYKLMLGVVVPRPIALVSTLDGEGRPNAAPFSFFNAMITDPPLVVFGLEPHATDPAGKDTLRNIRATGEFVVNGVNEAVAKKMNVCAVDFPAGWNEMEQAGLTMAPSTKIKAPRIAESPYNFECRRHTVLDFGKGRAVVVGEILAYHIQDEFIDPAKLYVKTEALGMIGRMHGRGWYARTTDRFEMRRLSFAEWQKGRRD
ncbi:MAG: flavin reductase family protein [Alphaproteobacteria bacterium]|nr:flavin reductase family protein [Alphaproteobacteria bacterium]